MRHKEQMVDRLTYVTSTLEAAQPLSPSPAAQRIVIVGGGASGALTALNLLRAGGAGVHVTIAESSGAFGVGVAYGTTDERHLLNVRAGNMSAFPDAPSDMVEWFHDNGEDVSANEFVPRMRYARYLQARLGEVADDRLDQVAVRVTDVERTPDGFRVHSESGAVLEADVVVLAYGNQAPRRLAAGGEELPDASWHIDNPWDLDWIGLLPDAATVVLVGSGLTAIDTAITVLEGAGPDGDRRVVMASRHGLVPRPHIDEQSIGWVTPIPAEGPLTADGIAELVAAQIAQAEQSGVDWRHVVDGLRGPTQMIWSRLDDEERRRFLSRYAREWEVRRHRMATKIAARVERYQAEGRLTVAAGGIAAVTNDGDRALVEVAGEMVTADAVVNCTGPQTDITTIDDPLLRAMLGRGLVAPDPLRLGLDTSPRGEVIDAEGNVVPGLLTVGPPRKGVLYETTAIPEIRVQAAEVAALITAG